MYRGASWNNIAIHQPVKGIKETNEDSININPYCCKITISRLDKPGPVTMGHIPRAIWRYVSYSL